jgi:hypothetical protein
MDSTTLLIILIIVVILLGWQLVRSGTLVLD